MYWYPIYCYFRNGNANPQEAEDLTQDYFGMLIRRGSLENADAGKGKLRAYLLASAKNFAASQRRRERAQKRGGGERLISIDTALAEKQYAQEPQAGEAPDLLFERAWARALLARVRSQVAASYTAAGKSELFEALEPFIHDSEGAPPYLDLAARLGVGAGSLRVSVFRLRQKFRALLEREIADTVADRSELEAERLHLMALFSG